MITEDDIEPILRKYVPSRTLLGSKRDKLKYEIVQLAHEKQNRKVKNLD